jgi:phosphoribosylformylglycinamidine synthase
LGNPSIDLELEGRLHRCCFELTHRSIINSAHDCSDGGLLVCLAESCLANGLGFTSQGWRTEGRLDTALFGEAQSRIIVSLPPKQVSKLEKIASKWQVTVTNLGMVGGSYLIIKDYVKLSLENMEKAWLSGLDT